MNGTALTLNAALALTITATLIPLVVGIVTKSSAPSWVKSCTLIVLGTVATMIAVSTGADGVAVISKATLLESFRTVVMSIAMYFGVWAKTVTPIINAKTGDFGITAPALPAAA